MDHLEAIVRDVAATEPMLIREDDFGRDWLCGFCEVVADHDNASGEWKPVEHWKTCPWRRAREWVDAQGEPVVTVGG